MSLNDVLHCPEVWDKLTYAMWLANVSPYKHRLVNSTLLPKPNSNSFKKDDQILYMKAKCNLFNQGSKRKFQNKLVV